jgi:outer membrane protein TolC
MRLKTAFVELLGVPKTARSQNSRSSAARSNAWDRCAKVLRHLVPFTLLGCVYPSWSQVLLNQDENGVVTVPTQLTQSQFVRLVLQANKSVRSKRYEQEIAGALAIRADAAFQPQIEVSTFNGTSRVQNTPEESLLRQGLGLYERRGQDLTIGLSGLVRSGAKVELKGTIGRFLTNINETIRGSDTFDFKTFYGATVTQPLARDAGVYVTESRLRVARLEEQASIQVTLDTESSTVTDAVLSYLDLALAQQRLESWNNKIAIGERLISDTRALVKVGRLSDVEVWEVENNLARFRAGASEAEQLLVERSNKLRSMLMIDSAGGLSTLRATDPLPLLTYVQLDYDRDLQTAKERRSDYRARVLMLERENVQLMFAQNQKLPRLDLIASYGFNGLAQILQQSLTLNRTSDYPSWSIGLRMSMPLGENRQADADLRVAQLRRDDAGLGLNAIQSAISTDIANSHEIIRSSVDRYRLFAEIADRESRMADALRRKIKAGRAEMRELLISEERVINARLAMQEQAVINAKGQALLALAQGRVLERFVE